jgi:hypothetical protein
VGGVHDELAWLKWRGELDGQPYYSTQLSRYQTRRRPRRPVTIGRRWTSRAGAGPTCRGMGSWGPLRGVACCRGPGRLNGLPTRETTG